MDLIQYDDALRTRKAVRQLPVNGLDISYNPDDDRWYVCRCPGDEALATFAGDRKGFHNARQFASRFNRPSKD